jgi:cytoskeleton protein RodZ
VGQFGEDLRRERETRGVTLETISEKTKVITRYLTALENDDFAALPGGILSKGIVRGYARTVGLDEKLWTDRFLAATQKDTAPQVQSDWVEFVENVGRTRPQPRSSHSFLRRWTGLAVILLLLFGVGFVVWRYVSGHVLADEVTHHTITAAAAATPPRHSLQ